MDPGTARDGGDLARRRGAAGHDGLTFDADLLRRHDRPGPRYTSYPTAPQFRADFGAAQLAEFAAQAGSARPKRPLSVYLHVPFCLSPCFYCGCNRIISRDSSRVAEYARRLSREIALAAPLFDSDRELIQLHLGGGTPNLLAADALEGLVRDLGESFRLSQAEDRDFSIELDPRSVPPGYVAKLAELGFNRVSLGVQDFDERVQGAVNRLQSVEQTLSLIAACRANDIRSVNVDLIYGLPEQTLDGFRATLRTVTGARPDRLAVYGYAHLPQLFKAQTQIDASRLPGADARLALLGLAIEELTAAGYHYIGMDHFALPDDELVRAQAHGTLQRNFMGYTTHAGTDLLGLGMSAISHVGDSFSQNHRDILTWSDAVDHNRLPTARGIALSADDLVRAEVISQLMCHGRIDVPSIEQRFRVDFAGYFAPALAQLRQQVAEGLVQLEPGQICVTPRGRLLLRNVAMCFDAYLAQAAGTARYSRAI